MTATTSQPARPPRPTPVASRPVPPRPVARRPGRPKRRFTYVPALDGVRGVLAIYVLLYHAGVTWVPGAILSMDVFFALSGFLITSLLVVEWQNHRRIDLKKFWARRARRLAPGLVLVLLAVAAYLHFAVAAVDRGAQRDDALAAVFYVANWRFIVTGQDYFAHFATPSPVLHLWSLAVEEQFYLFWPLIALAVFAICVRVAATSSAPWRSSPWPAPRPRWRPS